MDSEHQEKVEFRRELGLFGGISIIGGIMIGSGIFYLGAIVLQRAHLSMGMALLAWVLGGVLSILGGLCYAELGAARPTSGGSLVYLSEAYHPSVGYMNGFVSMLVGGAGSIAAVAVALPGALRAYIPMSDLQVKIFAVALIVVLTVYNCYGVKFSNILQSSSMAVKLLPLLLIMGCALFMGRQPVDLSLQPMNGTEFSFSGMIGAVAFATVAALWAYEGWTNLNCMAEEIKNPERNLPLSLIIGIGGTMALYVAFNYGIYRMLPVEDIHSMIASGNYYLGTEVTRRVFGNAGGVLVVAAMVIAMFNCENGMIVAFPRIYYAMAADGHYFKAIGKLDPKTAVPRNAMIQQAVISSILVCFRNLGQLTAMVVFVSMFSSVLTVLSVFVYRRKFPDLKRPYKIWGYPFTVIITVLLYIGLCINTLIEDPVAAIVGLSVPALSFLVYFLFDQKLKREKR